MIRAACACVQIHAQSRDRSPQNDSFLCSLSEGGLTAVPTCFRSFRWRQLRVPGFQWSRVMSLLRLGHILWFILCLLVLWDFTGPHFGHPGRGKVYPAKSMDASFSLWSKIQGSHLGVRKKTLDLATEGSSVSLGAVAYELCDFGQITPPL